MKVYLKWVLLLIVIVLTQGCMAGYTQEYIVSAPHLKNQPIPKNHILQFTELHVAARPYNEINTKIFAVISVVPVPLSLKERPKHTNKPFHIELCFYPTDLENTGVSITYDPTSIIKSFDQNNRNLIGGFTYNEPPLEFVPSFSFNPFSAILSLKDNSRHFPVDFHGPVAFPRFKYSYHQVFKLYFSNRLRRSDFFKTANKPKKVEIPLEETPSNDTNDISSTKSPYSRSSSVKPILLSPKEWKCFLLKFDIPTVSPKENFNLTIQGLWKNRELVGLPEIQFDMKKIWISHIEAIVPH